MPNNIIHKKIKEQLSQDVKLATILPLIPFPEITPQPNVYPELLKAITGQQLSVKAADAIYNRFEAFYGNAYPTPEILLETTVEDLRSVGMSKQKSNYLHNIATTFIQHNWIIRDWQDSTDEEILKDLTAIKGVGEWTVQMILMFALNRPNVFPINDLVIRKTMIKLYQPKAEKGKALFTELYAIAENWKPYQSYACHALWRWAEEA